MTDDSKKFKDFYQKEEMFVQYEVNSDSDSPLNKLEHRSYRDSIMLADIQSSNNFGKLSFQYDELPGLCTEAVELQEFKEGKEIEKPKSEPSLEKIEEDGSFMNWALLLISVICGSSLSPLMICQPEPILYKLFWRSILVLCTSKSNNRLLLCFLQFYAFLPRMRV